MKTLRAVTLVFALLLTSVTAFAGDGVLSPGADIIAPPPPPPASSTTTTSAVENSFLWYATSIWLQLRGILIQP